MEHFRPIREIAMERLNTGFSRNPVPVTLLIVLTFSLLSVFAVMVFFDRWQGDQEDVSVSSHRTLSDIALKNNDDRLIYVNISGAVQSPGVYELQSGSRINRLIDSAGGYTNEADIYWLDLHMNLAEELKDGEKVFIPHLWDTYEIDTGISLDSLLQLKDDTAKKQSASQDQSKSLEEGKPEADKSIKGSLIDINSAELLELDKLTGIGKVYAQKIIDSRPYKDFTDFTARSGVPASTLNKIIGEVAFY